MTTGSYQQFCPVAMAAEILCTRWTIILLREMFAGSTRFNELRRGVPRMSPALLSQRLKELEAAGIVAHAASGAELDRVGISIDGVGARPRPAGGGLRHLGAAPDRIEAVACSISMSIC